MRRKRWEARLFATEMARTFTGQGTSTSPRVTTTSSEKPAKSTPRPQLTGQVEVSRSGRAFVRVDSNKLLGTIRSPVAAGD